VSNNASHALTSIYDAASSQKMWDQALDNCVTFTGATSANLMFHDNNQSSFWRFAAGSRKWRELPPQYLEKTTELFKKYDEKAWAFVYQHPKQTLLTDTDFWDDTEKLESREDYLFLKEKMGFIRKTGSSLNDNNCWSDNIAFQFDKKYKTVPQASIDNIRLLLPHAAKAIEMWRTFSILKERYNAVLSALDFVSVGMCIASIDGSVIVNNEEAARILEAKDGLWLNGQKRIRCKDSHLDTAIANAISSTAATALGNATVAESLHTVERNGNEHPLLLEISPLRDSESEIQKHPGGTLITIIDPANPIQFDAARVSQAYRLTNAESIVCKMLVDGWTSQRIADERNVRVDTIKSQIKSILTKTGTKRRSELIRLALKATPPVR